MKPKGLIQIYYGNGKGKTSLAVGSIIRSLHYNYKICLFKFFKKENISGEDSVLKKLNIEIFFSEYKHPFFYYDKINDELKQKIFDNQRYLLNVAAEKLKNNYDVIVLDEVLDLIKEKIICSDDLISILNKKSHKTEVILTGHYIDDKLRSKADLISEIKKIKHYYDKGIVNRKGFDF